MFQRTIHPLDVTGFFRARPGDEPAAAVEFARMRTDLVVFARPPVPGACKTRLIPQIGKAGAAAVAARLTEATRQSACAWQRNLTSGLDSESDNFRVVLCVAGDVDAACRDRFANWLSFATIQPQAEGDLGNRLEQAVAGRFADGAGRVVVVGTDCPGLTSAHLFEATRALRTHDVVLGPALDGGYTLIGLRRPIPELFREMPWSTADLLTATRRRAQREGLRWYELQALGDVDLPDDLPRLSRLFQPQPAAVASRTVAGRVSVLIPSRGDADRIGRLIEWIGRAAQGDVEVLILSAEADPGLVARETPSKVTERVPVRVVVEPVSRAVRLNAGAASATGEFLLCLHADAWPPPAFDARIRETLGNSGVSVGAFSLAIEGERSGLGWVERGANWRSRWLGLPYGDQGLFCRSADFWRVGGLPAWPLLDDVALVRRLARIGQCVILEEPVVVSGRRWERLGIVRTTLMNQAILGAWFLGVSPERLAAWYRGTARGA